LEALLIPLAAPGRGSSPTHHKLPVAVWKGASPAPPTLTPAHGGGSSPAKGWALRRGTPTEVPLITMSAALPRRNDGMGRAIGRRGYIRRSGGGQGCTLWSERETFGVSLRYARTFVQACTLPDCDRELVEAVTFPVQE